ncbi:hypothetical protein MPF95_07670 [Helicobacter pylori]|nr:hypothetical protein [Helicobacter pylori]UOS25714.1 hypothetical protein MPF95_07670 [Helicobacter pylori]
MDNKNNDEVNIIQEYKKIYDECDIEKKIKVLGNIQKYQMDMLKFYPQSNPIKQLSFNWLLS